jgi:hypothetical protein
MIAGLVCFLMASYISDSEAYEANLTRIVHELQVMKKEEPGKFRDFRYALRHIRSVNKKQSKITSLFVAKAIADHVHEKRFRYTSEEHRLNFFSVIMGIIRVESGFNPDAVSSKNAHGLMQVHWPTWKRYFSSKENAHNMNRNLSVGTAILTDYMAASDNDLRNALYKYLGAKDDGYASKVIASALSFKKSVLFQPLESIPGTQ